VRLTDLLVLAVIALMIANLVTGAADNHCASIHVPHLEFP
jgi:hypothetical protein